MYYDKLRIEMIDNQLKARNITNEYVLESFKKVKRELFVPENLKNMAYNDSPLPIGFNQTISQPYIVAIMTQLLNPEKGNIALEVGTGSGYQAAILSYLVKRIYSMERIRELRIEAQNNIRKHNIKNVFFIQGDGTIGASQYEPFDRIIVTAASPKVPQILVDQLSDNGIMIIPVGNINHQFLKKVEKKDGKITITDYDACRFVPLIGKNGF